MRWLRGFAGAGNAVVLITHKLREALAVADDVTVLRRGRTSLQHQRRCSLRSTRSRARSWEKIRPATERRSAPATGDDVAIADNVSILDATRNADHSRRVVRDSRPATSSASPRVEGAGQRDLLRALAGRESIESGTLRVPTSVGFVPEDRHRDALVLDFTTTENLTLRGCRRPARTTQRFGRACASRVAAIAEFDVRDADDRDVRRARCQAAISRSSSGARARRRSAAARRRRIQRAVSTFAPRASVHDRLRGAAANGAGVVVYSSDLDEVLALATRVLVVHAGTVRESPHDRDAVGRAMLGVA